MAESFDLGALVEEFRDEARDQLDRVDAGLLELEREGTLGDETRSALLRTLHTLKGNAGMLGLTPIRDFVHVMENVVKGEPEEWSEVVVERLFAGAAGLRAAVEAAGGDRQSEAFEELAGAGRRLEELSGGEQRSREPREAAEETEATPAVGDLVRVPFAKLDALLAEVGDLLGEAAGLEHIARGREDPDFRGLAESITRRADALRESVMALRLVRLNRVLSRFHGLVRRLAREQGKEARLVVEGEATEVDKSTADALGEPLLHLVRNAIDHGIREPAEREAAGKPRHGTIRIQASQAGDRVRIVVEDDGTGLDVDEIRRRAVELDLVAPGASLTEDELVQLIFRPGFSTRTDVSTVSGQGVGLDVVAQSVQALRGELSVERPSSGGTRFVLRLPLTVAIMPSLVFEAGGELLALPTSHVDRTLRVTRTEWVGPTEVVREDAELYPVADADRLFDWPAAEPGSFGVLIRRRGRGAVLRADRLVEQRDLVVKAMPEYGARAPLVAGASVLPGGRVILVLDPREIIRLNDHPRHGGSRDAES